MPDSSRHYVDCNDLSSVAARITTREDRNRINEKQFGYTLLQLACLNHNLAIVQVTSPFSPV